MYYGEPNDCYALEEKAIDAWKEILKFAKLERRTATLHRI
jgi:hypothetical protein